VIALLLKHYQAALLGAVLLFGISMCRARDNALVEKGKAEASEAQFRERNERLILRNDSLTKAFRVDTLRLTRYVTRYNGIRDTVLHRSTDTLVVREFVHVADSTIAACQMTVQTCAKALAAKDSLQENTHKMYAARERQNQKEFTVEKRQWGLIGFVAGVGATLFFVAR